jgi:hypothetical protein
LAIRIPAQRTLKPPERHFLGRLVDPGLAIELDGVELSERSPPKAWLEAIFAHRPTRWLRRVEGRETFALAASPRAPESLVVKRTRGGESREAWHELAHGRSIRSPGRRECESLLALAEAGVPVPGALAWFEERSALGYFGVRGGTNGGACSAVLMRRVPHEENLRQMLERDPSLVPRFFDELLELVLRLHGQGFYHRDLYLQHFVPAPVLGSEANGGPTRLVLLDAGRARRQDSPRRRWMVKDLAALAHSSRGLPEQVREAFLRRYLARAGWRGGGARRFARAVLAKAESIARHAAETTENQP